MAMNVEVISESSAEPISVSTNSASESFIEVATEVSVTQINTDTEVDDSIIDVDIDSESATVEIELETMVCGIDGATFIPSVSEEGIISWTNDKGLDNPTSRNIKGPTGPQGPQGETGPQGPQGETGPQGPAGTTAWSDITGKPETFPPSAHTHSQYYIKPDAGIPKLDLTEAIQSSLDKADTAVQPSALESYSLISETGARVLLGLDTTTYKLRAYLCDKNGNVIHTSEYIDLPIEDLVQSLDYDNSIRSLVVTYKNGATSNVPIASIISGLATEAYVQNYTYAKSAIATKEWVEDQGFVTKYVGNLINYYLKSEVYTKAEVQDYAYSKSTAATKEWVCAQGFINNAVNDLVNYYLKSETYTKAEVQALIDAVKQFTYVVVDTLPTASAQTMNKIYLVPSAHSVTQNVKDEYITIESSGLYSWEQVGSTAVDLSDYYTKSQTDSAISAYHDSTKVDKVTGKGLSTNDYDNAEKQKVQDAHDAKHSHDNKSILDSITQALINTWDTVSDKVDKETGKGLSTNDYDATEKQKVTDAYTDKHTHSNKSVLDNITSSTVSKANSSVQPNDNVSSLNNDANYISQAVDDSSTTSTTLGWSASKLNTTIGNVESLLEALR